ncbi:DUF1456 family protein [Colwellia sp. D2M02]|uniref:DUF1456 family protein n=1 Tax=Colwellia asteriadis TaxID=517723 RepID=A0ABN1L6T8_9GAMM|nr:DUF1456 family protein [Colwellia sp. D2M02]MBU2894474.1 DUF1456 family protein [Colwellia sp. D2M02]
MINNDILRRIATIFNFDNAKIKAICTLTGCHISEHEMNHFFIEKNDSAYVTVTDEQLAAFLNGLIIEKRGQQDGPARPNELTLNNNAIFNKVKIALALKADDVIATLELAELSLGKYELSAFFRNANHKHYRDCPDDVLSAFLKGLKIQHCK